MFVRAAGEGGLAILLCCRIDRGLVFEERAGRRRLPLKGWPRGRQSSPLEVFFFGMKGDETEPDVAARDASPLPLPRLRESEVVTVTEDDQFLFDV